METLRSGSLIGGRYRLAERRATGASGDVWLAHDELLDCPVAAKIPHHGTTGQRQRSADLPHIASIDHPGLAAVFDIVMVGESTEVQILQWVDGTDLRKLLDSGPLPVDRVYRMAHDLAEALDAIHRAGLVHRDVKPANIMVERDGAAKLIDFDLAVAPQNGPSPTSDIVGTAKYMSPEQVRGHALDARSDTYSLCAVLYEALTGEPPFTGDSDFNIAMARLDHPPADPRQARPETPGHLAELIMRGLSVDPAERWTSIARPAHRMEVASTRRRFWPILISVSTVLAIAALGFWLVLSAARSLTG